MPIEKIVFENKRVKVGLFRCKPGDPHFTDAGAIHNHLLVFPRTSVIITHAGRDPIVTSPNVVMWYNRGQVYRRGRVSEKGDICEWFAFHPKVIVEALHPYDRRVRERAERLFRFTHSPSDPTSYLMQRMVVEHVTNDPNPNPLYVEETLLTILDRVIERAFHKLPESAERRKHAPNPRHRDLARQILKLVSTQFHQPLTLEAIAEEVHYSVYHMCRVFRQQTEFTIHQYQDQLRLRTALESLTAGATDLTDLAFRLGYSSHSHFSQSFRRSFGCPPSALQRYPADHHLRAFSSRRSYKV